MTTHVHHDAREIPRETRRKTRQLENSLSSSA